MKRLTNYISVAMIAVLILLVASPGLAAIINVSWNANTEADLAGYKMYYGTASGSLGTAVDVGKSTLHQLTLTPAIGTTYYFAVTAYDTSGNESAKSAEASAFVPDKTPPDKPTGIKAVIQQIIAWIKARIGLA